MDKALLMYRAGVRSVKRTLADGKEHEIFYKAATPTEIALLGAAHARLAGKYDDDSAKAMQKLQAQFIADHLCNEDGSALMTVDEAMNIPTTLKPEICKFIVEGSNETGDLGNG